MFVPAARLYFTIYPNDKFMAVDDSEGKWIYSIGSCNTATHSKRKVFQIVNGVRHPISKLKKKITTLHARCYGYDISFDNHNHNRTYGKKLFSVSKNDILQKHTDLNVKFRNGNGASLQEEDRPLLDNSLENDCYKIVGSWSSKSLNIYKLGSSKPKLIAMVRQLDTNDRFMVEVSSNVSYGFIISLIAAVDCLKDPKIKKIMKQVGKAVGFVLKSVAGGVISATGLAGFNLFSS